MINHFLILVAAIGLLLVAATLLSVAVNSTSVKEEIHSKHESTLNFPRNYRETPLIKGLNWADARDNYNAGWVIPNSLLSSDSYTDVSEKASKILGGFQTAGANTVRLPINPPSVLDSWWGSYKGAVDTARSMEMYVILGCWTENNQIGTVTDINKFNSMWDQVIKDYGSDNGVFFELLNEPFGYSYDSWTSVAVAWLARYPSIPRGRVLISGTGYSDHVDEIGEDSRFDGCLLSQHIYPYWASYTTDFEWQYDLQSSIGNQASRTIVTEYGAPMTSGYDYTGSINDNSYIAFMYGVPNEIRSSGMGSCYWPGARDGDGYRLLDLNGDRANSSSWSLTPTSQSGQSRVRWAWGY